MAWNQNIGLLKFIDDFGYRNRPCYQVKQESAGRIGRKVVRKYRIVDWAICQYYKTGLGSDACRLDYDPFGTHQCYHPLRWVGVSGNTIVVLWYG